MRPPVAPASPRPGRRLAGGSRRHNFLSNAMGAELRAALRGTGCHALSNGATVAIDAVYEGAFELAAG